MSDTFTNNIRKDSKIFQIAYLFRRPEHIPDKVDGCTLFTRFLVYLVPWIVCSVLAWVILGLFLGVLGQPIARLWIFLAEGNKLVYGYDPLDPWIPGYRALSRITIVTYCREEIEWLEILKKVTKSRSPIIFLASCLGLLAALGFVFGLVPFVIIPRIWQTLSPGIELISNEMGWISGLALSGVLLAGAYFGTRKFWRYFAATPSGQMFSARFQDWKKRHCTVYEVV